MPPLWGPKTVILADEKEYGWIFKLTTWKLAGIKSELEKCLRINCTDMVSLCKLCTLNMQTSYIFSCLYTSNGPVAPWENAGLSLSAKVTYETETFHCLCPKHEINWRNSHSFFVLLCFVLASEKLILPMGNFFNALNWSELQELELCIVSCLLPLRNIIYSSC